MHQPEPFLKLRVQHHSDAPSLSGLCIGYELGEWRKHQFASHVMEWLPEFSLTHSEIQGIHSGNMVALLREAAHKIYKTKKFENRGEFGEVFLHAAVRQVFNSIPAISKIYYKSANNDTVKGFDAVHIVDCEDRLEIWLGEAKFYSDIGRAIKDVVEELAAHMERDYLRDEFLLIGGKIDEDTPHAPELKRLLSRNTSLDEVFQAVCIPVLLTYDSECVALFKECSPDYCEAFENEVRKQYEKFRGKELPINVRIHLFLMPLESKRELVAVLDEKLKGLQGL